MGEEESLQGMMGNMNQVVMEINPDHEIIRKLDSITDDEQKKEFATTVYDIAAMSSGYDIDDPADFTKRVLKMMAASVDGVADAEVV